MEMKERLQQIREEKKLSKRAVSDGSGIPYNTYIKYEYGEREIGVQSLQKLADFYGVSTDYLLGRDTTEPPENPLTTFAKKENLKKLEKILLKEYLDLSSAQREAVLDFMRRAVSKEGQENPNFLFKTEQEKDDDYITVSTTLGELEDQMKADEDAKSKDA